MAELETSPSDLFDSVTPLDIRAETHQDENITRTNGIPAQSFDKNIPAYMDETNTEMEKVWEDKQSLRDSIDVLNDDCLMHVFSFLNYSQRFNIEKVCIRWQEVSYVMWRSIHSLDFTSPPMSRLPLKMITLKRLLKRCNTSLLTLNLCVENHMLDPKALTFIAKYCQNLEELYLFDFTMNQRCLRHLSKSCTRLKKIVFDGCKYFTDNDLMKWFSRSQALTSITITKSREFNGLSLAALTTQLEQINLNFCDNMYRDVVLDCVAKHGSSLNHLSLDGCTCFRGCDVGHIVKSAPNLKFLSLSYGFSLFNNISLLPLGNLAHLQELNLKQNRCVSDQIVAAIVEGCKELTQLNLSGCRSDEGAPFTDVGLANLRKLPKLTSLNISYLSQTNDVCLKKLTANSTRLKFIKCKGCPELSDSGCTQVVSLFNELELLDLSGNERVTNETVRTALDSVKMFTHRKPLELIVGGTLVNITSDDNRLIINQENLCNNRLRPDFMDNADDEDDRLLDELHAMAPQLFNFYEMEYEDLPRQ